MPVYGRSAALAERNSAEEECRVVAQRAQLGAAKCAELASQLEAAIALNERPIPDESLTAVPIPDLAAVGDVPIVTLRATGGDGSGPIALVPGSGGGIPHETTAAVCAALESSRTAAGMAAAPLWVEWSNYSSALVNVCVGLDTSALPDAWRPRLAILLEMIWQLPATLDGGATLDKDAFVQVSRRPKPVGQAVEATRWRPRGGYDGRRADGTRADGRRARSQPGSRRGRGG